MPNDLFRPAGPAGVAMLTRRRAGWAAAVAVVLVAVTVPAVWWSRADGADQPAGEKINVATAEVVRTDMSTVESLPGRLGYGAAVAVKGRGEGTVTWLPKPGASVKRGKQLYRVDDQPVVLFYGALPLYRALGKRNTVGRDVRVVARNLDALGYAIGRQPSVGERVSQTRPAPAAPEPTGKPRPGSTAPAKAAPATVTTRVTVRKGEGVLTASLIRAIKRWQADLGRPVTGTVAPADVVVVGDAVRVDSVTAAVGDEVAAPLMNVTPTAKVITVSVEAGEAGAIERGDKVSVLLPGEKTSPGEVTAVGTEVKPPDGESADPNAAPKLAATVTLDDPKVVSKIDSAEVEVQFAAETHEDVLAVPIGALVALSEGGYAVQLAGGGLVAVEVGMFAKGLVEVTADGLEEGASVVTTS
ncbi:efflux RND transporter periplasmic adaptor subunit [Jidongwangia harbinensis]|uniref:efflux RND transporter periplasmic adaptor subunit n=1 Tax=Jidongwangia harbinensis TaxID=2878561 RepID=UPI001CDA48A8|nr:efflux RND transporter periplasmic adaptor subunit [Jidongwangia harbinensis]MCA2215339.1 efflux RND transporter periplasmic adaptor subunit [Jidongwangia harbinensis]